MYGNVAPPPPDPVFIVIGNVEPFPFVNVIVLRLTEAVKSKLPVSVDPPPPDTVTGNVVPSPFVNVIVLPAADAVVNNEPVGV
jgi:hypothetical protein